MSKNDVICKDCPGKQSLMCCQSNDQSVRECSACHWKTSMPAESCIHCGHKFEVEHDDEKQNR